MSTKTWIMACSAGDWQSGPFTVSFADPDFRAASERMAQHVLAAHVGADSVPILLRQTADLQEHLDDA
jgi:hypothetical protein